MPGTTLRRLIPIALLILGLSAGPAKADAGDGVIEGQLVNDTSGGSRVANQTVTLGVYDDQQQIDEQTTETDADGAFRFDGLATGLGGLCVLCGENRPDNPIFTYPCHSIAPALGLDSPPTGGCTMVA